MLDARQLKQRYQDQWAKSNARERFVLLFLKTFLPREFEPKLTGLGAGSADYVSRTYRGLLEAFDITVYYDGAPLAFVEVTGIDYSKKPKRNIGYCVGEWKLEKAYKHRVQDRVWIAFVLEAQSRILWAPVTKFYTSIAVRAKIYEDEDYHRCIHVKHWHPWYRPDWRSGKVPFLTWLRAMAATHGPLPLKRAGVR